MVSFNDLLACRSCGSVFSKWAGISQISKCPNCKSEDFDTIEEAKELEQE
jgi:predicted Zn-ribbon and HTH transcriptional regulator